MKLAKEPKDVDFVIKSELWTEEDLADFRRLMQEIKRKNKLKKNSAGEKSAKNNRIRKAA